MGVEDSACARETCGHLWVMHGSTPPDGYFMSDGGVCSECECPKFVSEGDRDG